MWKTFESFLPFTLEVPCLNFPCQLIPFVYKINGKNTFFFISSTDLLRTETHSSWLSTPWLIILVFHTQCLWITNNFDSFIPSFWRIELSSINSPRINRIPPWSVLIRLTTSLFFGHEPIIFLSLTPHKLHPLGHWVDTLISNPFFNFVVVMSRLESWYGIVSLGKTRIPWYLSMKRVNSPIA